MGLVLQPSLSPSSSTGSQTRPCILTLILDSIQSCILAFKSSFSDFFPPDDFFIWTLILSQKSPEKYERKKKLY